MYITKEKALEQLQKLPDGTALYFYLIPHNGKEEDGDQHDITLKFADVIHSGNLEGTENPTIDFGFQIDIEVHPDPMPAIQDLLRP